MVNFDIKSVFADAATSKWVICHFEIITAILLIKIICYINILHYFLTFSCVTLKNSQTYFENLAVFTRFLIMFVHFSIFCSKGLTKEDWPLTYTPWVDHAKCAFVMNIQLCKNTIVITFHVMIKAETKRTFQVSYWIIFNLNALQRIDADDGEDRVA